MFSIGEFATLGRVSVRMLRHYDAIGLLRPDRVDARTGYRYYRAAQLQRLNRLVALKELGFGLEQVRDIVDDVVDAEQLRGMLRLRRAELAAQIAADRSRLLRVEARLRLIEKEEEGGMSTHDVEVRPVPATRYAAVGGSASSQNSADIGPVVSELFGVLFGALGSAGGSPAGPPVATYAPDGQGGLRITVGCPVGPEVTAVAPLVVDELPGLPRAACHRHHGTMDTIEEGYQILAAWIDDHGHRTDGTAREVYLVSAPEPQERWVTELQMPITDAPAEPAPA